MNLHKKHTIAAAEFTDGSRFSCSITTVGCLGWLVVLAIIVAVIVR